MKRWERYNKIDLNKDIMKQTQIFASAGCTSIDVEVRFLHTAKIQCALFLHTPYYTSWLQVVKLSGSEIS